MDEELVRPTGAYIDFVHKFLIDYGFQAAAIGLQKDAHNYFDINHFKSSFRNGNWDECKAYFNSFTGKESKADSLLSQKILFLLAKQKYISLISRNEQLEAIKVWRDEMQPLISVSDQPQVLREFSSILLYEKVTSHEQMKNWSDSKDAREAFFEESVEPLLKQHSTIKEILTLPRIGKGRLIQLLELGIQKEKENKAARRPSADQELPPKNNHDKSIPTKTKEATKEKEKQPKEKVKEVSKETVEKEKEKSRQREKEALRLSKPSSKPTDAAAKPKLKVTLDGQEPMDEEEDESKKRKRPLSTSTDTDANANKKQKVDVAPFPLYKAMELDFDGLTPTAAAFHPAEPTFSVCLQDPKGDFQIMRSFRLQTEGCVTKLHLRIQSRTPVKKIAWSPTGAYFALLFQNSSRFVVYSVTGTFCQALTAVRPWDEGGQHKAPLQDVEWVKVVWNGVEILSLVTIGKDSCNIWNVASGRCMAVLQTAKQAEDRSPIISACVRMVGGGAIGVLAVTEKGEAPAFLFKVNSYVDTMQVRYPDMTTLCPRGKCSLVRTDAKSYYSVGPNANSLIQWTEEGNVGIQYSGFENKSKNPTPSFAIGNNTIAVADGNDLKFWKVTEPEIATTVKISETFTKVVEVGFNSRNHILYVLFSEGSKMCIFSALQEHKEQWTTAKIHAIPFVPAKLPRPTPLNDFIGKGSKIEIVHKLPLDGAHSSPIDKFLISPNGSSLTTLANGKSKLWTWKSTLCTNEVPEEFPGNPIVVPREYVQEHQLTFPTMAFVPGGGFLGCCNGGIARCYQNTTRTEIPVPLYDPQKVFSVPSALTFDPQNGNLIFLGLVDGRVTLRQIARPGKTLHFVGATAGAVTDIIVLERTKDNPNAFVITAGADGCVKLWKALLPTQEDVQPHVEEIKSKTIDFIPTEDRPMFIRVLPGTKLSDKTLEVLVRYKDYLFVLDSDLEIKYSWTCTPAKPTAAAAYTCNGKYIVAGLSDGTLAFFSRKLELLGCATVSPHAIRWIECHPTEPFTFAYGNATGALYVIDFKVI